MLSCKDFPTFQRIIQGFKQPVLKEYSAFIFGVSGCPLLDPEDEPTKIL
jgi:hypothetical protein